MILLLHPTHRKFVKLLRNKVGTDGGIILLEEDAVAIRQSWEQTTNSHSRHQKAYRVFINAANRKWEDICQGQINMYVKVDQIESYLRRIELKNPGRVLYAVIATSLLELIIKLQSSPARTTKESL